MWDIVRGLTNDGVTVLLTTQYLEEADQLADDIVVIDHGRVIANGTPDALKTQVGGQVLEVRPVTEADNITVARVVDELVGSPPQVEGGLVTVAVKDAAVLPAIVRRLDDSGVIVSELSLRRSSLDEVFLSLTGHRAEDTDIAEPTTEGAAV
jgi:oleandomycin transport system ATP-binding protein